MANEEPQLHLLRMKQSGGNVHVPLHAYSNQSFELALVQNYIWLYRYELLLSTFIVCVGPPHFLRREQNTSVQCHSWRELLLFF